MLEDSSLIMSDISSNMFKSKKILKNVDDTMLCPTGQAVYNALPIIKEQYVMGIIPFFAANFGALG